MSDMPDFENMSPEEAMRWMETLAKRQGADASGFLTTADAEVADVDPDTVIDEPGYTPSEGKKPEPKPEPEPEPEPTPPELEPEPAAPEPTMAQPAEAVSMEDLDFENMSPDEAMRWMETLAKRQGADASGFLTTADAEVADVDPDSVVDEPGYTPYGEKPAAAAQQAKPEPAPPEPEPEPAETDWLAGLASDVGAGADVPDLDDLDALTADLEGALGEAGSEGDPMAWLEGLASSQPEPETPAPPEPEPSAPEPSMGDVSNPLDEGVDPMAWLENLARNQGAKDEEMTTSSRMDIPTPSAQPEETSPGYEPYDVDDEGTSEPVLDASDPGNWLAGLGDDQPTGEAAGSDGEDWLAGLGGDQSTSEPAEFAADDETEDWLAGLGGDQPTSEPAEVSEGETEDWLAGLAADDEPDDVRNTTEWLAGLTEQDETADEDEEGVLDGADPAAWLGELGETEEADSQQAVQFDPNPEPSTSEQASTGDPIADMLNRGETPSPEDMQAWMGGKMSELLSSEPLPLPDDEETDDTPAPVADPDAPPEPGELPDWLQDMAPVEGEDEIDEELVAESDVSSIFDTAEQPAFTDEIPTPDMPEMPDWLTEDIPQGGDSLADIFDTGEADDESLVEDEEVPEPASTEVDTDLVRRLTPEGGAFEDDPWVQAIKEEQEYNYQTDTLPQWYEQRIQDPKIRDQFESLDKLEDVSLPEETQLPPGEREPMPGWLAAATGELAAGLEPTAESSDDSPDWLNEPFADEPDAVQGEMPAWLTDMAPAESGEGDIPAWLTETLPDDEEDEIILAEEPTAETPPPTREQTHPQEMAPVPAQPEPTSPVPVPQSAQIDVGAVLTDARARRDRGDIEGALQEYERVVRANARLETVVSAVVEITKQKEHKQDPAAYRVLGDALMRQGKLQAALDTYRKALNLL